MRRWRILIPPLVVLVAFSVSIHSPAGRRQLFSQPPRLVDLIERPATTDTSLSVDPTVTDSIPPSPTPRPSPTDPAGPFQHGQRENAASYDTAISADGNVVAFDSEATNLVPDPPKNRDGSCLHPTDHTSYCRYSGIADAYVHDFRKGTTELVATTPSGEPGNSYSRVVGISSDGRYVAFSTFATNLVPNDTNMNEDVFVKDLSTGRVVRASVMSDGAQIDGQNIGEAFSSDGRYVVFDSEAKTLQTASTEDRLFVHDVITGETSPISIPPDGQPDGVRSGPAAITPGGEYVAWWSQTSDGFDQLLMRDRTQGSTRVITSFSVEVAARWGLGFPSLSADGHLVAYDSHARSPDAGDVYVYDARTGTSTLVSVSPNGDLGNGHSEAPSLSADGRYVAFESTATNLVTGDVADPTCGSDNWRFLMCGSDVFIRDLNSGITYLASVSSSEEPGAGDSGGPSISADGTHVAFWSRATNFVDGAPNECPYEADHQALHPCDEMYLHSSEDGSTKLASIS